MIRKIEDEKKKANNFFFLFEIKKATKLKLKNITGGLGGFGGRNSQNRVSLNIPTCQEESLLVFEMTNLTRCQYELPKNLVVTVGLSIGSRGDAGWDPPWSWELSSRGNSMAWWRWDHWISFSTRI